MKPKIPKLLYDYRNSSDKKLEARAIAVETAMIGNDYFKTPDPTIAQLKKNIKAFSDSLAAASTRDTMKAAIKNECRNTLILTMDNLLAYVTWAANGNIVALKSSGFTLLTEKKSTTTIGTVNNFAVKLGNQSGQLSMGMDPVAGADAYIHLWSPSPIVNNQWCHIMSKYSQLELTDLVPLTSYSFQSGALGSKDQTVYSEIITKTVV